MTINFNWRLTAFSAFFLVVFVNLGFWQLDRASEKEVMMATREAARVAGPLMLSEAPLTSGQPVTMRGEFDENSRFLLDNRVLDGAVGYEVLVPFQATSGQTLLVNRGFVAMGRTRQDPPVVPGVPVGEVALAGEFYQVDDPGPVHAVELGDSRQWVVQSMAITALGSLADVSFEPAIVRLAEGQPGALPRYWPDTVMQPEKHRGYAIQWFAMATALAAIYLFFTFRNKADD